ncbi:MAG: HipA N-terminal domain-containing protein, partial [Gammaproteobacteria bacterium]|nr:HipA N-terminal domain-containing protein [Gammaproteobacteria bacterium]
MSFEPTSLIHVSFMPEKEKIPMGRLALKDRQLFFEYNLSFIQRGLELSPFKLPLKPGVFTCDDPLFGGLWGVFNDSLPDGWGRLLLDRKLMKMQVNPGDLSPLDRLRYVGHRGMGALIYEPEIEGPVPSDHEDLDTLADEATHFQNNDDDRFIDTLLDLNGSSAGARPKMLTRIEDEDWIIKFR